MLIRNVLVTTLVATDKITCKKNADQFKFSRYTTAVNEQYVFRSFYVQYIGAFFYLVWQLSSYRTIYHVEIQLFDGVSLKQMEKFKYLGVTIMSDIRQNKELDV